MFKYHTPVMVDGKRLFYRKDYDVHKGTVAGFYNGRMFIKPKETSVKGRFRLLEPSNVITQIRLYRWFIKLYMGQKDNGAAIFSGDVEKNEFVEECFWDYPNITKRRVGRLLRMVTQYQVSTQKRVSGKSMMCWRWGHPLDIAYGLEHLILTWLPRVVEADGGSCKTSEEYKEELEVLQNQGWPEDAMLTDTISRLKLK